MFPGPNARVYYNEAGEPLGWDYPPDPEDSGMDPIEEDRYWDEKYAAQVCDICGSHPEDCDRCFVCEAHLTEANSYECDNPQCLSLTVTT